LAGLGTINRTGGAVNLGGTLVLGGGTLALNVVRGLWFRLVGGSKNGTVSESGGALLAFSNAGGTLTGVTVNGTMDLSQQSNANRSEERRVGKEGRLRLGSASGNRYDRVYFADTGTAAGSHIGNATA